jgi:hypothetical protein
MYDCGDPAAKPGERIALALCPICFGQHPNDLTGQCTWFYEFELAPVISSEQERDMAEALEQTEYA